jgi:aminoglycoside phosphotransferase (APT) family kinase protein
MDFEPQVLQGFLEARLPDLRGPMRTERIGGGQSNPTYFVTFGNRSLVLRKQPASSLLPSDYGGIRGLDLAALGIPPEAEYLRHYYLCSGRPDGVTAFHFAFALFRMAVIFEGIAARAASGNAAGPNAAEVGGLSGAFARRAVEFMDGAAVPAPWGVI